MTYLTRPVFEFDTDWLARPGKTFRFDLRSLGLGFGAEVFAPLQTHVTQGYELSFTLQGEAIAEFDAFTAALTGRLNGFWLPVPMEGVQIVTADDASHFYIADQNLRATFADHPDIYLWLVRNGTGRPAKISAVNSASLGRERITLTAGLATPATTVDMVYRLHYVRLASDEEGAEFVAEGIQRRTLRVVELPTEYEAWETGQRPIFLYHFWCDEPMNWHWRYTSFAADVVSDNQLHTAFALEHGALRRTGRLDETLEITAAYDAAHPFALFLPLPLARPLNVTVSECSYADPDTATLLFTGQVRRVEDAGESLKATCDSWTALLARKVPKMMLQKDCNWAVFEPGTCQLERWKLETGGTVVSVDNVSSRPTLTIQLRSTAIQLPHWLTADWFAGGFIETGLGVNFKVRSVLNSADAGSDQVELTLNAPLTVDVGATVQLLPGCSGTAARCTALDNFANFAGFPAIPERNLSLKALDATTAQGGKK